MSMLLEPVESCHPYYLWEITQMIPQNRILLMADLETSGYVFKTESTRLKSRENGSVDTWIFWIFKKGAS